MEQPFSGQRWVSDNEPELGLGMILQAEFGRVHVHFPAANEQRQYALKAAPLRRVRFAEGDKIKVHDGADLLVTAVEERGGLLFYQTEGREVAEAELSDTIAFSKPEERLLAGQVDDLATFDLRAEALHRRSRQRQSAARGFVGGRVDLIPHQLSIAGEVAGRWRPRVLLADEVGLGKTIEAGLILQRLHLTGRANRVLILVPEPLIHQWFVELLRRFNLLFSLFDEERCASIELHDPEANPFLDSQFIICSVAFLSAQEARVPQARDAGWDLLIVDEAHHLEWSPAGASAAYGMVETLARATPGLLLLTATPQQLGAEGHFARLRLLDPERYADLPRFLEENAHYEEVAAAIDRILSGAALSGKDAQLFAARSERVRRAGAELAGGEEAARARLVAALLDEFGTGRVMFRNTRAALTGFPRREPRLAPLPKGADETAAKIAWLLALLRELGAAKILLICQTRVLAEEIAQRVQAEINLPLALFHEGLTLLQRDRNAAYFAEDEGARLLLCSEIGSEGRNFQFAHHLVLFDLPANPELLEQRIGRLDRIGQTETIQIHVPYVRGTEGEVLARWYHEGLNAFAESLRGGAEIAQALSNELEAVLAKPTPAKLEKFLAKTRKHRGEVTQRLARGHDRLLELNSPHPAQAAELIRQIQTLDGELEMEAHVVTLLDHFGVQVEELASRTYLLQPGHLLVDALPGLPVEGLSVTFDRTRALNREDFGFMSADHPMVRGAWELLISAEAGNASFGLWKTPGSEAIFLEAICVAECVAPAAFHADRFLPATPIRVVVDHALVDHTADEKLAEVALQKGDIFRLLDRGAVKKKLLPAMLAKAQEIAATRMASLVASAQTRMSTQLQNEVERLEDLRQRNDHVRPEEIAALREQKSELAAVLQASRLRLDAVRLIFRTG